MTDTTTRPDSGGRLAAKVAIVTGGGTREGTETGTGRASSIAMAREGARIVVADLSLENAERTVAEIVAAGGEAVAVQCDATVPAANAALIDSAVEHFGALHVLMNNLGGGADLRADLEAITEAQFERGINMNLKSATFATKFAIAKMREAGGGSIINVSSIDGLAAGMFHNTAYGIAKGALHMLTRTTAVYHGRDGIRANCIAPGPLHASMTGGFSERTRDYRRRSVPLGTEGTAWDIAHLAVFLASDESRWVSGVTIPVDGGMLAAAPLTAYGYIEGVEF